MAVNGFNETAEITEKEEKIIIPLMVKGLSLRVGEKNAITSGKMISGLKQMGHNVSGVRIRKMIHYIRMTGIIELLVATSKGYYICNDIDKLNNYIESLHQRAESITKIAEQMEFQLNKIKQS